MREERDGVAVEWDSPEVEPDIRLHDGVTGAGERVVVLIRGCPQTSHA